ncbi:MAG: glycosyltransferase family 4 protein [Bacteroidetes bacterium]|nr:glycosyltransferase family 4 protein [Bacteroidota bacterium]
MRSTHKVRVLDSSANNGIFHNILWQFYKEVVWCDLTFSWFGKLHAFFSVLFSKIFGKKAIVVAGGDDVANVPEIKYGMFAYWWKKWCPLFVFKYADLILPVSKSNLLETIENTSADPARVKLLYHGFDAKKWQPLDWVLKENLVLTVGSITNETFRKKGLDHFVKSAMYLPDVHFVLVGPWHDSAINWLQEIASSNVIFTGGLYGEDLIRMYSRAKVYVQASIHESFGCSVAEAMLCECVPVVSNRAALPEVVGDCGFYVDNLNPENVAERIKEALYNSNDLGKKARERIRTYFPLEKRKRDLLRSIDLLGS